MTIRSETPAWQPAPARPQLQAGEVHLWCASLDTAAPELHGSLSADEWLRANRFHLEEDRERYLAARGLLREILSRYLTVKPCALQFTRGAFGKPALLGVDEALRFNLSHSGDLMLLAVTRSREIGVDVEAIRENVPFELLAEQHFTREDLGQIRSAGAASQASHFYRLWTATEAQLKADGTGLVNGTKIIEPDRWSVLTLTPAAGYAAALAVEGGPFQLTSWSWQN